MDAAAHTTGNLETAAPAGGESSVNGDTTSSRAEADAEPAPPPAPVQSVHLRRPNDSQHAPARSLLRVKVKLRSGPLWTVVREHTTRGIPWPSVRHWEELLILEPDTLEDVIQLQVRVPEASWQRWQSSPFHPSLSPA